MSFEADLRTHILGSSSVADIVAERVYPMVLPQESGPGLGVPAITYTVVFGDPENCMDGFTSGVMRYSVQLDCWSSTFTVAARLALAVRDRMNQAALTFSAVVTQFPALDDFEPDTKRYRRSINVSCMHVEA